MEIDFTAIYECLKDSTREEYLEYARASALENGWPTGSLNVGDGVSYLKAWTECHQPNRNVSKVIAVTDATATLANGAILCREMVHGNYVLDCMVIGGNTNWNITPT